MPRKCSLFFCSLREGAVVARSPLTQLAEKSARPSKIDSEFSRLSQRAPTSTERELLALSAARLAQKSSGAVLDRMSLWVDGLLSESLVYLAAACGAAGGRALLVSPLRDQLGQRQLRLAKRAPFFPLPEGAKSAAARSAETAWATPDELDSALVSRVFGASGPDFIFVEEAHCATPRSSLYRPSFKKLAAILERYPRAALVCSSTTSALQVRREVAERFGRSELAESEPLHESALLVEARARFQVLREEEWSRIDTKNSAGTDLTAGKIRNEGLAAMMATMPRPALLLCSTIAQADEVYASLLTAQLPVHRYHSGMAESERAKHLLQFSLPGRRALMVATSGFFPESGFSGDPTGDVPEHFGPGYCRRDIRTLVHLSAPASLEQFVAELGLLMAGPRSNSHLWSAGDAAREESRFPDESSGAPEEWDEPGEDQTEREDTLGRPGPPVSLLIYHPTHLALSLAILDRKRPTRDGLIALARKLAERQRDWINEAEWSETLGGSRKLTQAHARFLLDAGLIEMKQGQIRAKVDPKELLSLAEELGADLETMRALDHERARQMASFAETESCRLRWLESLLGRSNPEAAHERNAAPCGRCDICSEKGLELVCDPADLSERDELRDGPSDGPRDHENTPFEDEASPTETGAPAASSSARRLPARRARSAPARVRDASHSGSRNGRLRASS